MGARWMKGLVATASAVALALLPCRGHGASYVPGSGTNPGPGDTVPAPPPGAGLPSSFSPHSPGAPGRTGPTGPSTPGQPSSPGSPSPMPQGPTTPPSFGPGSPLSLAEVDAASWELWWNYERHRWLTLRARFLQRTAVTTGSDEFFLGRGATRESIAPSRESLVRDVVPTLVELSGSSGDVQDAALIALAKAKGACELAGVDLRALLRERMLDANVQVAETAVLALGMLRDARDVELLERVLDEDLLALGSLHGLKFEGRVPYRLRAAAAYALGACAPSLDGYRQLVVANALRDALSRETQRAGNAEVAAACALALGIVDLPPSGAPLEPVGKLPTHIGTREHALAALKECSGSVRIDARVRGQAAAALLRQAARLDPESPLRASLLEAACAQALARETDSAVRRAIVIALPWLAGGSEVADSRLVATLRDVSRSVADSTTRARALLALGEVSGESRCSPDQDPALAELVDSLQRGPSQLRPWAGLALGIRQRLREARREPRSVEVSELLRGSLRESKSAYAAGAYAIALGIDGDPGSASLLSERLSESSDPAVRGYLCLALGLVDAGASGDTILAVARGARAQPAVLSSASLALGLLGRRDALEQLVALFDSSSSQTTQAGLGQALGLIGDTRAIGPLARMARDDKRPVLARAFAVVALGGIASELDLPWNDALSRRVDYLSGLPVLASPLDGRGVLDIL